MQNPFARILTSARKRIMVISAKGGVGKSTTTVNLAAALTARGLKVGIFDADVHGPNIPALLGVHRRDDLSTDTYGRPHPNDMLTVEARLDSPDMRPIQPLERYGMQVMSFALLIGERQAVQTPSDTIGRMVTFMLNRVDWGGVDVLLLDMPPGTGEPLHALLETGWIDGAIVVTTREHLAHLDNGRLLSMLHQRKTRVLGVVENMTYVVCPSCGEAVELYPTSVEAERAVYGETPVLAALPFSPELIRQNRGGAPIALDAPETITAQRLLGLADSVIEKLE